MFKLKKIFAIAIVGLLINKSNGETVIINDNGNWSGEIEIDEKGYWYSFISDVEERTVEQKGDNQGTLSLKFFGDVDPIITKEGSNTITVTDKLDDDAGSTIERSISFKTHSEVMGSTLIRKEDNILVKNVIVGEHINDDTKPSRKPYTTAGLEIEGIWGPDKITKYSSRVATVLSICIPEVEALGFNAENIEKIYRFFSYEPKGYVGNITWGAEYINATDILYFGDKIVAICTVLFKTEYRQIAYLTDENKDGIAESLAYKTVPNASNPFLRGKLKIIRVPRGE